MTLVSTAQLTTEDGTTATVKETWGTLTDASCLNCHDKAGGKVDRMATPRSRRNGTAGFWHGPGPLPSRPRRRHGRGR